MAEKPTKLKIRYCPICGEKISEVAVTCKYCKSRLKKTPLIKPVNPDSPGADETRDCPFCGNKISETALICRHCKTDLKEYDGIKSIWTTGSVLGVIALIVFAVVIISYFGKVGGKVKTQIQEPAYAALNAIIRIDEGRLVITNKNIYPWTPNDSFDSPGVEFIINNEFVLLFPRSVPPNVEFSLNLESFTKKDGTKFNPLENIAKKLKITCKEDLETFDIK